MSHQASSTYYVAAGTQSGEIGLVVSQVNDGIALLSEVGKVLYLRIVHHRCFPNLVREFRRYDWVIDLFYHLKLK